MRGKRESLNGSARAQPFQWKSLRNAGRSEDNIKLFVDGLDKDTKHGQVRKLFERFGKVLSVFVPRSCKRGRRANFGFVMFQYRSEGLEAMKCLHGTRLNTCFLSINPARFIDRKLNWHPPGKTFVRNNQPRVHQVGRTKPYSDHEKRKHGTKKIWRVKQQTEKMPAGETSCEKCAKDKMNQVRVEHNAILPRLIVASLVEVLSCDDVQKWLWKKGYVGIQIKPFGAKEKVLEFESPEESLKFLLRMKDIPESIFSSLVPATASLTPKGYLVWLKLWKIPLGFWTVEFISKVTGVLGSLVCLDDETKQGKRFDVARALIVAEDPILENQIIPITIDGVNMDILVEIDYIFFEEKVSQVEEFSFDANPSLRPASFSPVSPVLEESSGRSCAAEPESSPVPAGGGHGIPNVQTVDDGLEFGETNDECSNGYAAQVNNNYELTSSDWPRETRWSWDEVSVGPINMVLNGCVSNINNNLIHITVPTEGFNLLLFGSSFPINSSFLLGRSPLAAVLSNLLLAVCNPISNQNGGVLIDSDSPCFSQSVSQQFSPASSFTLQTARSDFSSEFYGLDDEEALKRVKQGLNRASKLQSLEYLELGCAKPGEVKKKRGRKPKSDVGPAMLREITEGLGGVDPELAELQASVAKSGADKYLTRATKVWYLGKSAGLAFPGSDADAIRELAKELEEDHPGSYD